MKSNQNDELKTYLLRFLSYGVMPPLGTMLGYATFIIGGTYFLSMLAPLLHSVDWMPSYRLFDSRVPVFQYMMDIGFFIIFIVFLIQAIMRARHLVVNDSVNFGITWVKHAKKFLLLGFWSGLCLSQFLFRIVLPLL